MIVALAWFLGQLALAKGPPDGRTIQASLGSIVSKADASRASWGEADLAAPKAVGKCRQTGSRLGAVEFADAGLRRAA
jgi:hypothetical protein